ncbi:nitrate ABC transporter permease [Candidatus Peregrinibacteria bacterium]|nr:MAG: nitrate ABC transporter permease [Candidatus Peregrinibacteria bacterium]
MFFGIKYDRVISFLSGLFSIALLVFIWEYTAYLDFDYTKILPPPTQFLSSLVDHDFRIGIGSQSATLLDSIISSTLRVTIGLLIAFIASVVVGVLISSSIWIKRFIMPIVEVFAPIAPIAWIPLALILFGIGDQAAVFIVFMGVFFILTITAVKQIETVPKNLINIARSLGCSQSQIWLYVITPYVLPGVFTMLRINVIAAWMAVLAAEMTGLRDGLGAIIMNGRNLFNHDLILLGMLSIGIMGFLFNMLLKYVQDRFLWWDSIN